MQIVGIASDIAGNKRGAADGVAMLCAYMAERKYGILDSQNYLTLESKEMPQKDDVAKHIELLYDFFTNKVAKCVERVVKNGDFPFIISGDHSSALASVQGVQNALPNEKIGIIWIDAHADIHTPFSTFSGNLHGMPLAALIGHKATNKNILTTTQMQYWDKMMAISLDSILPENIVYCGVRSLEQAEQDVIDFHRIVTLSIKDLQESRAQCLQTIQQQLARSTKIYVSVDIDVLDSNVFESTGCNEPNGLEMRELIALATGIIESFGNKIVAFELSEFNPKLGTMQERDKTMMEDFLDNISQSLLRIL